MGGDFGGQLVNVVQEKVKNLFENEFNKVRAQRYLDQITFTGWISDKKKLLSNTIGVTFWLCRVKTKVFVMP